MDFHETLNLREAALNKFRRINENKKDKKPWL
jgi:hypothetical protein